MRKLLLFLAFLAACTSAPATGTTVSKLTVQAGSGCVNPADFGAVPNDGIDDGPAFRAALASVGAKNLCVPAGHWTLNYFRFASVTVGQGQSITGVGPATIFDMTGSAGNGTWYGFDLRGGSLRNLSVNQVGISAPDNAGQNHMVQVGAGDSSVISDVVMGPGGGPGFGDCIRFLGTDSTHQVTRAIVSHVVALQCSRDAIGFQHDVASVAVDGSIFESIGDQDLDYEPSSSGITRGSFVGNIFLHSPANHAFSVTLSDQGVGDETLFEGNLVLNGNVEAVRASGVGFIGNTVIGDPVASSDVFDIIRNSVGIRVEGNFMLRPAGAPANYVIRLSQNNSGFPQRGIISGNVLIQNTASEGIYLEGASRMIVAENEILMTIPWAVGYAMACQSIGSSCDMDVWADNVVESPGGTTRAALFLGGYATGNIPTGRNLVIGNMGSGFTYGVWCAGPFGGPVRIDDNVLGGTVLCPGASVGTNL